MLKQLTGDLDVVNSANPVSSRQTNTFCCHHRSAKFPAHVNSPETKATCYSKYYYFINNNKKKKLPIAML